MKVAVLLAGRIRGWETCLSNIRTHIFQDHSVDIYGAHNDINIDDHVEEFRNQNPVRAWKETHQDFPPPWYVYDPRWREGGAGSRPMRICSMFYNIQKAWELIENVSDYDVIMYMRVDMHYTSPLVFERPKPGTVYIPNCYSWGGLNDQMAYGDVPTMRKYCHLWDKLESYINTDHICFHPETLVRHHLEKEGVNVCLFPYYYTMEKSRTNPDIAILTDII